MKTLRELALRGTMAAVSESLHLSASAISQQISTLEDEVGIALIERRGRGVQLTPAGERLVQWANQLIAITEDAKSDMAEMRGIVSGEVRMASFPSIAAQLLPKVVKLLRRDYPGIQLIAEECEPMPALIALRSWQCDIAIFDNLSVGQDYPLDRLETFPLYDDELVAVLHAEHPLARQGSIRLKQMATEQWAIDARPNTFSDVVFDLCAKQGFRPGVMGRFDAYDVISALIGENCAVSVLPRIRVQSFQQPQIVSRRLDPPVRRAIMGAVRANELRRPTLKATVDAMIASAGEL